MKNKRDLELFRIEIFDLPKGDNYPEQKYTELYASFYNKNIGLNDKYHQRKLYPKEWGKVKIIQHFLNEIDVWKKDAIKGASVLTF